MARHDLVTCQSDQVETELNRALTFSLHHPRKVACPNFELLWVWWTESGAHARVSLFASSPSRPLQSFFSLLKDCTLIKVRWCCSPGPYCWKTKST